MSMLPEAKSLRWLVNMFPLTTPAKEDSERLCNAIHLYAKAGADKLDDLEGQVKQMAQTIDYARAIQAEGVRLKAERDSMAAYLKSIGCDTCKHEHCDVDAEPCESCMEGENFPAWEWRGE